MKENGRTAWVTGASSGLGMYTAQALRDAGWTVIAGARSFSGASPEGDGTHRLALDVTDGDSVERFCREAKSISARVDALVQCAAILTLGSAEETSVEEYRRVMETNFFGMIRMNRQVLPMMRAQKAGKIVLFSSINGLLGIPFQNAYTASKHAVEGYAEGLQMEVRPFGIQVCLIEPGDHRGGGQRTRLRAAAMGEDSPYAAAFRSAAEKIRQDEAGGSDPAKLGRKVAKMLDRKTIPFRKRIAKPDQRLAVLLHDVLPPGLNERILTGYYIH
ncbi:MAG: SDR family oxidoreductase [Clostridia bacterium]|nr:SDR family oxidoreductase [Clostridia bacterium]